MITVNIKENSKQAKIVIEMLKTFDFVDFPANNSNEPTKKMTYAEKQKAIKELSKKVNKAGTKKAFEKLGLDYDSYSR